MKQPIGLFDSGVGGISVLRDAIKCMPNEDFVYFADDKNAPYGTKTEHQIRKHALNAIELLLAHCVKAIVIACNTATAAAALEARSIHTIPIIGMEPALKPASLLRRRGKILVLASPLTLSLPKFHSLMCLYGQEAVAVPCPGLMEFVERGEIAGTKVKQYLSCLLTPYLNDPVDALVLGCTHYIFLRPPIIEMMPEGTYVIDGNEGTVKQLKKRLGDVGQLTDSNQPGKVLLLSSGNKQDTVPFMKRLLHSE